MKFGTWLVGLIPSLLAKILVSLGFSVVTLTGASVVIDGIKNTIIQNVNSFPQDMYNLFLLAGGGIFIGFVFGAAAFNLSMFAIRRATSILAKPAS